MKSTSHDFGKDIIPALLAELPTYAYRFYDENKKASNTGATSGRSTRSTTPTWICAASIRSSIYTIRNGRCAPISRRRRPAKFVFAEKRRRCGEALDSIISPGCISPAAASKAACCAPMSGCTATAIIEDCILMPGVRVGRHARIRRAIIDRDVLIPRGAVIGFNPHEDESDTGY